MVDFVITNFGEADGDTHGDSDDSVTAIYTVQGGVTMTLSFAGGNTYGGTFDGPDGNDIPFTAMERFGFEDRSSSNDYIWTGMNTDTILAGGGDDRIYTESGNDQVDGGTGNDLWGASMQAEILAFILDLTAAESPFLQTGVLRNVEGLYSFWSGSGNDRITMATGQRLNDWFDTGPGDDRITMGLGGDDSLGGGLGTDTLVVTKNLGVTAVTLSVDAAGGGTYSGTFEGASSADRIIFGAIEHIVFTDLSGGDDTLLTGGNADTINAGAGNDRIVSDQAGSAPDIIDGGAGIDIWGSGMQGVTQAFVIDLTRPQSRYLDTGILRGIEALNYVEFGSGNDRITVGANGVADQFDTREGDDRISMRISGQDSVNGGVGSDTLVVINSDTSGGVTLVAQVPGGLNFGVFDGPGANDLNFTAMEFLVFTDTAGESDRISGRTNGDTLNGGGGADTLDGAGGNDRLDGGKGKDVLVGGDGADRLTGGAGNDLLTGGAGIDRFVFAGSFGRDRIADFRSDGRDIIDLSDRDLRFSDLTIRSIDGGDDTLIVLSRLNRITLEGFDAADLTARMFDFG